MKDFARPGSLVLEPFEEEGEVGEVGVCVCVGGKQLINENF